MQVALWSDGLVHVVRHSTSSQQQGRAAAAADRHREITVDDPEKDRKQFAPSDSSEAQTLVIVRVTAIHKSRAV